MLVTLAILVVPHVLDDPLPRIDERGAPEGAVVAGTGLSRIDSPGYQNENIGRAEGQGDRRADAEEKRAGADTQNANL